MRANSVVVSGLLFPMIACANATADNWFERDSGGINNPNTTDAGQSLAQSNQTMGAGTLSRIQGQLLHTRDCDMFAITITDEANFSAVVTTSRGPTDTNLFLFDSGGNAVCMNDNDPLGQIGTRSRLSSQFVSTNGLYYLAISRNDRGFGAPKLVYPLNSTPVTIFNEATPNVEQGPVAADPLLASFRDFPTGFGDIFNTDYRINLTGAGYAAVPAPGAFGVLAIGVLGLTRRRR